MRMPNIPTHAKRYFRLFKNLVPLLPTSSDSLFNKIVKGVSMVETVHTSIKGGGRSNIFQEYLCDNGLTMHYGNMAGLLSHSKILDILPNRQLDLDMDSNRTYEVQSEQGTFLLFITYDRYSPEASGLGLPTPFDCEALFHNLWTWYGNNIAVTSSLNSGSYNLSEFKEPLNPLFGSSVQKLDYLVSQHRKYRIDNHTRIYLFHGEPGTGKSTCSKLLAMRTSERVLLLDISILGDWTAYSLLNFITSLNPDFVLIDDVDRCPNPQILLPLLDRVKQENSTTSFVLTVNDLSQLDRAVLRPGRIDTVVEFHPPDDADRRDILQHLIKTDLDAHELEHLVKSTKGMSPDYLQEIALRMQYEEVGVALENVTNLWNIALGNEYKRPAITGTSKAPF